MSAAVINNCEYLGQSPGAISLPTPKLIGKEEIVRPSGYVLPGQRAFSVTLETAGRSSTGFGEGSEDIATKKATSEASERLALYYHCHETGMKETSNGWAAHLSKDLATRAATLELIERDVALSTWENGGPFFTVPKELWPTPVGTWGQEQQTQPEYFDLKIFLSSTSNGACISALLFNGRGNFVAGHASAYRIDDAILSAANECMRAAHLAVRFEYITDVMALHADANPSKQIEPGAHSLAYAYGESMPDDLRFESASIAEVTNIWSNHQANLSDLNLAELDILYFQVGNIFVARVKHPRYRQIYWGKNYDLSKRNLTPHFVG